MVRFYDPSRTDPSLHFIRGVQSFWNEKQNALSEEEIRKAMKVFFKDQQYKKMFADYIKHEADFPNIVVNTSCPKKRFLISPYMDYTYYKSSYDKGKNEITLCSNFLFDILDLKENIDRELVMAYDYNIRKKDLSDNEEFSISQIRACRKQYDNFGEMNDDLKKNLVQSCGKYLMKNRGPNKEKMPFDIWVRYCNRMIKKNMNSYFDKEPF